MPSVKLCDIIVAFINNCMARMILIPKNQSGRERTQTL
jgi:hypothetical protein